MTTPSSIYREGGESSRANSQTPTLDLGERVTKYLEEGEKLREEAWRGCSSFIYRVLPRLKENNGSSQYKPVMVSIGPYYYNLRNNQNFKMAEDCKRKCFGSWLVKARILDKDISIRDIYEICLECIRELEEYIRNCYSEYIEVSGFEFHEMMVLDACFIIEIIDTFGLGKEVDSINSLAAFEWMVPYFFRDFLLLENQIPFFVVRKIFSATRPFFVGNINSDTDLIHAALEFFKNGMKQFDMDIFNLVSKNMSEENMPLHLLDLVRSNLIPRFSEQRESRFRRKTTFIPCVSKLLLAGITVNPVKVQCFLEVNFREGVIEMPKIVINDLMRCLLLNCVAFEQRHKIKVMYFSIYATFLDCLVNTPEDIEHLCECNVIDNYLADDSMAADFINCAGKDLVLNTDENKFYLGKLFRDVNEHYRTKWKWQLARFKGEYIEKPWLFLSAAGGILLVLGTLVQAIVAYLTYKYK